MQERIYKQIPKQRKSVENYEQPYPIPEVEVNRDLGTLALEHIDELVEDE